MSITILGIESSCDDTSSSVIRDGVMLSNVIASQAVHEAYGGVVPELASRAHQQNIIPVVAETGWYTFKNPGTKLLQEDGKINESLFSDGLHPNEEGYKRIVDEIAH